MINLIELLPGWALLIVGWMLYCLVGMAIVRLWHEPLDIDLSDPGDVLAWILGWGLMFAAVVALSPLLFPFVFYIWITPNDN